MKSTGVFTPLDLYVAMTLLHRFRDAMHTPWYPPPPTPLLCADMQMLVSWDNGSEAMFQLSAMPALYLGKM